MVEHGGNAGPPAASGGSRRIRWLMAALVASLAAAGLIPLAGPARPARAQPASEAWTSPGYWLASSSGGVFTYGAAGFYGSAGALRLARPIVGMAVAPSGRGYWLVGSDGGVFSFGDAGFHGSTGAIRLNQPVVGVAATSTGAGYWLVAADGGIFSFGDADFYGSTGALHLKAPVVAMAATPSGHGYWLVAADGGIFTFGDAGFYGSLGRAKLPAPVTAMAATPSGHGYWLVRADGAVASFGDAGDHGSPLGAALAGPLRGAAPTPDGGGYVLAGADGGVFTYGDAVFHGAGPAGVVAVAAVPPHPPARVAIFYYPWYASQSYDGQWRHWDEGGHSPPDDIGSDYYPQRGAYSSGDPTVVDAQMADIAGAGVNEVVSSWWGSGSFEDQRLSLVAARAAAHGLAVGVQIEPYDGRTAASVGQDIAYLHTTYGISDFWVYRAQDFAASDWTPVLSGMSQMTVWAESFWDGLESGSVQRFASAAGFSGVYSYDPYDLSGSDLVAICGLARMEHLLCSPSVAPGFSAVRATGQAAVVPRSGGARYDDMWAGAIRSVPDVVSITSYNEWHEGSMIEPASAKCLASGFCYQTYDGAWGLTGSQAEGAYLAHTASWAAAYAAFERG